MLPLAALGIVVAFEAGNAPGSRVEFEDAHVIKRGGELYPPMYTVARFNYRGGWTLRSGDSLSFLARGGRSRLEYSAPAAVAIQIGAKAYQLEASDRGSAVVQLPSNSRVELTCLSGTITLDAIRCQIKD
jgi:hypothetical protein